MKYLTQLGSISSHKAALLLMIRERSASRSQPVSQAGKQGCEQVANNGPGVVAMLGRMIPISF